MNSILLISLVFIAALSLLAFYEDSHSFVARSLLAAKTKKPACVPNTQVKSGYDSVTPVAARRKALEKKVATIKKALAKASGATKTKLKVKRNKINDRIDALDTMTDAMTIAAVRNSASDLEMEYACFSELITNVRTALQGCQTLQCVQSVTTKLTKGGYTCEIGLDANGDVGEVDDGMDDECVDKAKVVPPGRGFLSVTAVSEAVRALKAEVRDIKKVLKAEKAGRRRSATIAKLSNKKKRVQAELAAEEQVPVSPSVLANAAKAPLLDSTVALDVKYHCVLALITDLKTCLQQSTIDQVPSCPDKRTIKDLAGKDHTCRLGLDDEGEVTEAL